MVGTRLGKRGRACSDIWEDENSQPPATRRRVGNSSTVIQSQSRIRRDVQLPRNAELQQENLPSPPQHNSSARSPSGYIEESDDDDTIVVVRRAPVKIPNRDRNNRKITTSTVPRHEPTPPATPHKLRYIDITKSSTPSTPKHRVTITGIVHTPKTPRTPRTPSTSLTRIYSLARKAFARGADAGPLIGRESERKELDIFLTGKISANVGGCIYISGPPGTGKSAAVQEVCGNILQQHENLPYTSINCMSINSSSELYSVLLNKLNVPASSADSELEKLAHENLSQSRLQSGLNLVVLDEIDHLLNLDLNAVYRLFEWSMGRTSPLILIGIANALDLTDRFLPRLKARNLKPALVPFLPYSAADISSVLTSRARSLLPSNEDSAPGFTPFLHPMAIQLISKKVAAQTGDLRKAFDIAQRCIDLVENETREKFAELPGTQESPSRTPLAENPNLSSPPSNVSSPSKNPVVQMKLSNPRALTPTSAPRALVSHVVKATAATFGNGTSQRLKALNLQQKAILCALVMIEQKNREESLTTEQPKGTISGKENVSQLKKHVLKVAAPAIRELYDTYSNLCKRDNLLHRLTSTEFRDVVENLETLGLISSVDGKNGSFANTCTALTPSKKGRAAALPTRLVDERRITANAQAQELKSVTEGTGSDILQTILRGEI